MNTRIRNRILGVAAACAMGLSLSGCVAYDNGYGSAYGGGGGYYGGGYGGGSVNVYAPVRQGNRVNSSCGDQAGEEVVVPCCQLTPQAQGVLGGSFS